MTSLSALRLPTTSQYQPLLSPPLHDCIFYFYMVWLSDCQCIAFTGGVSGCWLAAILTSTHSRDHYLPESAFEQASSANLGYKPVLNQMLLSDQ